MLGAKTLMSNGLFSKTSPKVTNTVSFQKAISVWSGQMKCLSNTTVMQESTLNAAVQWGFGWIFVIWISGFYSAENHRYRCWFPPHPRLSCNTSSNHGKYCKLVQFIDFTVQCVIHYHLSPNGCSVLSAINAWLQCVIRYHVTAVRYPLSPDCP